MGVAERIAIDDDRTHLVRLTRAMKRNGMPCDSLHFDGGLGGDAGDYGQVRIIYVDLHLGSGSVGADPRQDFSLIGGILEGDIQPRGPYAVILWTAYPHCAPDLRDFLGQRLKGVSAPVAVQTLSKTEHLAADGSVLDEDRLVREIHEAEDQLEPFLDVPDRVELQNTLRRLFAEPASVDDVAIPGLPALDVELVEWMGEPLSEIGMTPREMVGSQDAGNLFLLERVVHSIATSRAHSHPKAVLEIVRRRIEGMCLKGISLTSVEGPDPRTEDRKAALERWMNTRRALYGNETPRQFFAAKEVDTGILQEISARLDAIDDGAFS